MIDGCNRLRSSNVIVLRARWEIRESYVTPFLVIKMLARAQETSRGTFMEIKNRRLNLH